MLNKNEFNRRVKLLGRLAAAEEDERRRIARELHDRFGQILTLLKLQTRELRAACDEPHLLDHVEALEATIADLDDHVHDFLWEVRPEILGAASLQTSTVLRANLS